MKFSSKERKLTSSQKTMEIELGLADQKKAIELLYSQYSTPIKTCVQELVSNAFDAMQDAGRSHVPIKITLPNDLNEFYFSVRDFGNSMDDDAIKNVYMKVNASTKSRSNKAIGGFGIGSKTPWAYTDTFILKTFLDGLETQYALVKGRSSVAVVYQGETTQENGTEILFKTKPKDQGEFKDAVRLISLCAKVKPIVNSNIILNFSKIEKLSPLVSVVGDKLLDHEIYANMGGVLYNIPDSLLYNSDKPWRADTLLNTLERLLSNDSSFVINFPIGSLLPLQTREALFTKGDEGQNNKVMIKKVLAKTLEAIEKVLETKKSQVVNTQGAIAYFSHGLLQSTNEFTFNGITINDSGLRFKESFVSNLTRKRSRGWGGITANTKKTESNFISHKDLGNLRLFYSELSANKARICKRLHSLAGLGDVIVFEKHRMSESDFNFLKNTFAVSNIETVDIPKTVSSTKGVKKDDTKVVYYNMYGDRRGSFSTSDKLLNKVVIMEKDDKLKCNSHLMKALGFDVWWVAKVNLKKLKGIKGFYTQEQALDFDKIRDLFIMEKYTQNLSKLQRPNEDIVLGLASPRKKELLTKGTRSTVFAYDKSDLELELYKRYGSAIDRAIQVMLKRRSRVTNLVDKAPLVAHIDNANRLKGQAKKDLESYITERIGG